jgi:asparagine synthase (glutamine-hydrolysing)
VAIDGECYGPAPGASAKTRALVENRPAPKSAALIGRLFLENGPEGVTELEGAFSIVIHDPRSHSVHVYSDRFGLRPLAWARRGDALLLSSRLCALTTAWSELEWSLDYQAVADFMTFEHILGDKTPLKDVRLVPNASHLTFRLQSSSLEVDTYWGVQNIGLRTETTFEQAVREAGDLFCNAVERLTADGASPGVYLTSGLDSRAIGGVLAETHPGFSSITYGMPGCRDLVWGSELARQMGSHNIPFPLHDGHWIFESAPTFIGVSESFVNVLHAHGINTYETAAQNMDFHMSGYGGGSFYGGDTTIMDALEASSVEIIWERLYNGYVNILGNTFRSPFQRYRLFTPQAREAIGWGAEASFLAECLEYEDLRKDAISDCFTLNNRYKKMFSYMIAVEREFLEDRAPFLDYALMDYLFSLPAEYKTHRKMQLGFLDVRLPHCREVPWQVTAKPPTLDEAYREDPSHKVWDPLPTEPGRNYPKWLYESGMDWAKGLLLDERTADRGIFEPAALRELLDGMPWYMSHKPYQEQRNLAYRIGAVATFESMLRRVLDGE